MTTRGRTQSDLTSFAKVTTKPKLTAIEKTMEGDANKASEANASLATNTGEEKRQESPKESEATLGGIMSAINGMKTDLSCMKNDFTAKLEGILIAMESIKKDMADCATRVTQAETRISSTEDGVDVLQNKVKCLEKNNKYLEEKVLDLETRSRGSNVRLVNLPEGAEANDVYGFLESWIPEALELGPLRKNLTVEKAHRLGQRNGRTADSAPRTLIMKFLSHRDKEMVMRAARAKQRAKQHILYKDQPVQFYQDVPAEMHKKRREFGEARRQLRQLGLRYGMIPPARLIVTYKDRTYTFNSTEEADLFIQKVQSDNQED
ncbi:hypothetical protein WMY93_015287 [Mugilogobius chulae]|uniref:L1 transposable element RRM domain-containing protein n=1 Tax=Mugilogobius chulae TaxID=88201 RepID=A0AAW0P130_9GOBI